MQILRWAHCQRQVAFFPNSRRSQHTSMLHMTSVQFLSPPVTCANARWALMSRLGPYSYPIKWWSRGPCPPPQYVDWTLNYAI